MKTPTVFLVDDDESIRTSLSLLLETKGMVVEAYESGEAFLASFDAARPGCLVLDLRMPGMSGIEVQQELVRRNAHLPIIFLSAYGDIPTTVGAIKGGAEDFMTKPPDVGLLVRKIQDLLEKGRQDASFLARKKAFCASLEQLSPREREILGLAVLGLTSKDVADRLTLSQRTVENHRLSINKKLNISNLLELSHQAKLYDIDLAELHTKSA